MKTKIPIIFMLSAGAITAVITYLNNYDLISMLWALVIALVTFYILGIIIVKIFSSFKSTEDVLEDEGTVIEKNISSDIES